jgi:hypothetical protein
MSFQSWFRRIFKPSTGATDPAPDSLAGAPGVSRVADIETAEAIDDINKSTEPPANPSEP